MAILTIIIPSYNKGQYISEALDSIFMQETTYSYEIIIADDCSQDNTLTIVKKYQNKFPNKIKLLTSESNQKLYRNVLRAYAITKSDYFCVLDPDDYWIDKKKIQKSLDFLEANKDYTIYVTNTLQKLPDGTIKPFTKNKSKSSDFQDYLKGKAVLGCTLGSMYRNVVFKNGLPSKMINLDNPTCEATFRGDSFRNILHIAKGKAYSVKDYDAVYRITKEGLWQGSTKLYQHLLNANAWINFYKYYDEKYPELILIANSLFHKSITKNLHELTQKELPMLIAVSQALNENKDIIHKHKLKNLKFSYWILYKLYTYLHDKLKRKGLIE